MYNLFIKDFILSENGIKSQGTEHMGVVCV